MGKATAVKFKFGQASKDLCCAEKVLLYVG